MVHDVDSMNIRLTIEYLLLVLLDAVADLRGGGGRAPDARLSLRPKIFSISCTFSKNLAKSYVGAPSCGESWIRPCGDVCYKKTQIIKLLIHSNDAILFALWLTFNF